MPTQKSLYQKLFFSSPFPLSLYLLTGLMDGSLSWGPSSLRALPLRKDTNYRQRRGDYRSEVQWKWDEDMLGSGGQQVVNSDECNPCFHCYCSVKLRVATSHLHNAVPMASCQCHPSRAASTNSNYI